MYVVNELKCGTNFKGEKKTGCAKIVCKKLPKSDNTLKCNSEKCTSSGHMMSVWGLQ